MKDAERHMREKGCVFGLLRGRWYHYGSSGWRDARAKLESLGRQWAISKPAADCCEIRLHSAGVEDIPFLSALHERRNSQRFGPAVRTRQYWEWALDGTSHGTFVVVSDGAESFGYFHFENGVVDEMGWNSNRNAFLPRIVSAIVKWAAEVGKPTVTFYGLPDVLEAASLDAFGSVEGTFSNALGKPVEDSDPRPYSPEAWPDGWGQMVKSFNLGPGILSTAHDTESLLEVIAHHSWNYFDADAW